MNKNELQFVFCTECGAKNEPNANFCTSCGNKLIKPEPTPVVMPTVEEPAPETTPDTVPVIEEPASGEIEATESAVEETKEEEVAPEVIPVLITEADEPIADEGVAEEAADEEDAQEETTEEDQPLEVAPVIIAEAEEPITEENKEEPAPEEVPLIIPEAEEAKAEESAPVTEEPISEEKEEETASPVIVPVTPSMSKKEEKLAKKLEEAKKQAQEEARKQAEKEAERARKAEAKAEKAAEKARTAEEKSKKSNKKAEKPSSSEAAQNNSHYYYNHDKEITEATATTEKPKKKRKQNFFLKILSFLLALILMASLIIAIPITLLNMFFTSHNIEVIVDRAISGIDINSIELPTAEGTKTLSGAIHDITNEVEGWNQITEEQINEELLEDFVKQLITDTLSKLGMSIKDDEATLGWTPEDIYAFIESNEDTITELAREAGYTGNIPIKENKDQIIANIEDQIGEDGITAETLFGGSDDTQKLARYLDAAQAVFSVNVLYLAWGLVAFIVILIIFTNLGYFGAFCRTCGFPAFIIGTLYFLVGLGVSPLLSIVTIPIPIFADAIKFTAGFLGALLMDISLIVLAVGLVLVIISFISDAIRRKIDSKKNA